MKIVKRSKNSRQRGTHTHGWGSKKKHRGAGNRGGRGMAGTGKRGDQKKTYILKKFGNEYFGKKGFRIPQKMKVHIKTINVHDLNRMEKGTVNLKEMGYDKLLGKGKINRKVVVTVQFSSKRAMEKIQKAGGEIKTA